MTNWGNGSHVFTLRRHHWVTMEEIAPPLHVGGDRSSVTMEIGVQASSILAGFKFVFWESSWVRVCVLGE